MAEIVNSKIYHKGINKNYSNLYINIQIDDADILSDYVSDILLNFFADKKIPFEVKKHYEVLIFPDYVLENAQNNSSKAQVENDLYEKSEGVRTVLTSRVGINIDSVFLFGNLVSDKPSIIIEIVEHPEEREIQTFVMIDKSIQERLKNYYFKYMHELHFQNQEVQLTAKRRKLLNNRLEGYLGKPISSLEEIEDFMWAVDYVEDAKCYRVIFRYDNEHVNFHKDSDYIVTSKHPKVFDLSIFDKLNEMQERNQKEQNENILPSIPNKKVNLNFCKYKDLTHIPNFNARMYDNIVLYRETKLFESIDELKAALKVGDIKFNKLKKYFEI
jgi:hypothetical protein